MDVATDCRDDGALIADPVGAAPAETRVFVLRCFESYSQHQYEVRFNPATYVTQNGQCQQLNWCPMQHSSRATGDLDHFIEFHVVNDPSIG